MKPTELTILMLLECVTALHPTFSPDADAVLEVIPREHWELFDEIADGATWEPLRLLAETLAAKAANHV